MAVFTVVARGCSWGKGGVRMGVWAVMLRRGKNKYIAVGDTAAGLWLFLN